MTSEVNVDPSAEHLDMLTQRLSLEEKVRLVSGGSAWSTAAIDSIGLRPIVLSDGPSGVRGAVWDERRPSLCLPSATALGASWDVDLASRYGEVVAAEARAHDVDVVLGPTVNLHRSPLGGRSFEAFSEDPVLTASLAAAYVRGVQSQGVAASIKHYVANDFETDRYTADVHVSERALRELYLLAFEQAVTEAKVWSVMSAYNSINGVTATENDLLSEPLNDSWGFDGVVVSDWTAVRSIASARGPQDLAMPGPAEAWSERLVAAVRNGEIEEAVLDRKTRRMLTLAARVGAFAQRPAQQVRAEDGVAFAREAATAGMVLLHNNGVLPLSRNGVRRIAVIGEGAANPRVQGGGSATVVPAYVRSPLDGIRAAFADASVDYAPGARIRHGFIPFTLDQITNPVTGEPGARLVHLDVNGGELLTEDRYAGYILDFGNAELTDHRHSIVFSALFTPAATGRVQLGFASPGTGRLHVDGELVLDATLVDDSDQVQAFFTPPFATTDVQTTAGSPLSLRYEFVPGAIVDGVEDSLSVTFGIDVPPPTFAESAAMREEAVQIAAAADVVIVVVGTTEDSECEGIDRADLALPGGQDALVADVIAANPRTIVAVNAGAPVEMPWRADAAALLLTWFGGQEYGSAFADVLTGASEPGGRLPTTWPATLSDAPVSDVTPRHGVVSYDEGIHIGYRAWQRSDREPAYFFGHGLGYTTWDVSLTTVERSTTGFTVIARATNTGERSGKQVLQAYVRRTTSTIERPALWLGGFAVARAESGASVDVQVHVPWRAFAHWDVTRHAWEVEAGPFELLIATSAESFAGSVVVEVSSDVSSHP